VSEHFPYSPLIVPSAPPPPSPTPPPHCIEAMARYQALTFPNTLSPPRQTARIAEVEALEPLSDISSSPPPASKSQAKKRGGAGRENVPPPSRKSQRACKV
jgi:hypothetical protein